MITRWLPQDRAVVFAVRSGEKIVAALYAFVVGDTLQEQLDAAVDTLAYPNGGPDDYDADTIAAAREVATRMR